MEQFPTFGADLYSDPLLEDPYAAYRALRDLGPVVWLPAHRLLAIGRFADVRAALRADTALVSGAGVAANDLVNRGGAPITLTSDGETHARRRQVLIRPVSPVSLRELRPELEAEA
jgi:cytochrome P450